MAKTSPYGIVSVKLLDVEKDGSFPIDSKWETAFEFSAIVKDSFSFNDSAASTNNIEVEDMDEYYATLESDKGQKGFTLDVYDFGEKIAKELLGYTKVGDYITETVGFKLGNKAVRVQTKKFLDFPAKVFEWANMKLNVTMAGTMGKSGFPNIHVEFVKQAHLNAEGKEMPGSRWKDLADE